jgi:hypothetical protein
MAKSQTLRSTDLDGVYINEKGVHVDRSGVSLDFKKLKQKEQTQRREVLGHDVTEPHHLLKAISLDPRYPLQVRVDAAKSAAPYFAPKKLDRGVEDTGVTAEDYAARVRDALSEADASVGKGAAK